jgi:hypothetical protein
VNGRRDCFQVKNRRDIRQESEEMKKMKLAKNIGMACIVSVLAVSLPVNWIKADNCKQSNGKAGCSSGCTQTHHCSSSSGNTRTGNVNVQKTGTRNLVQAGALNFNRRYTPASIPKAQNKLSDIGTPSDTETPSLEQIRSRDFPQAILSISQAVKAMESGDKQTGLIELSKALKLLIEVQKGLDTHVKPDFANNLLCPILGSAIQPNKVNEHLMRDYGGRKIAFCSPKCPAEWDKLTETQKQTNLTGEKS